MFKNKCFICIFLIFALLSICAVNAEDSSLSNITSTEDIAVNLEVNDNEKLNSQIAIDDEESNSQIASGDDSVVEKPKVKNFTVLKNEIGNLANNDTLNLNCDYIHNGSGEPEYAYIFKNVTINGNGHIIDFNKSNFDFGFYGQYNSVIFKNFIFINAGGVENTSLVFHNNIDYGCFSIINSTFINHTAHSLLYTHESNLSVVNCSFINNTASEAVININWGGYALVVNCSFVNCSNSIVNFNLCDVINSTFVNNTARQYETIISTYGRGTIDNSIFENNTIENCGIANSGEMFIITNSKFINTKVSGSGIVISNYDGVANISNCTFMVNGEDSYIFKNTQSNVTIANSTFLNNDLAFAYNNRDSIFNLTNNKYQGFNEKNCIYNQGILTSVVVNILANQTIKTNPGNKITLFATITSEGLSVVNQDFNFIINETKYGGYDLGNGSYVFNYTVNFLGKQIVYGECSRANTVFVKTGTLESYKKSSNISVSVDNIVFGDNAIVNVNVSKGATGCVNITLNNKTKTFDLMEDCFIRWNISALNASKYNVSVVYGGDGIYLGCSANTTFTVSKKSDYNFIVNVPEKIISGETVKIEVILPGDVNGNVTVKFGNKTYTAKNGVVEIPTDKLNVGEYEFLVNYGGDNNYVAKSINSTFEVSKIANYTISIDVANITVGGDVIIDVVLPGDVNGNVNVAVDGKNYTVEVNSGVASVNVSGLDSGVYEVVVGFEDGRYDFNSVNTTFEVFKIVDYDFIVDVVDISVGENATVSVTLPGDVNGNVTVKFENKTYTSKNGVVELPTDKLNAGNYEIVTTYGGDSKYVAKSINSTFEVFKIADYTIGVNVDNITVGEDAVIDVVIPGDVNGNVIVAVDGRDYLASVKDGLASVNVSGLCAGVYDVFVSFENDKYGFNSVNTTFEVFKIANYDFIVNVADITVGENAFVSIVLPGDVNGNVTVKFGNNTYASKNGVVELPTDKLNAGNYEIVTTYGGDSKYLAKSINLTFEVSKISNYNIVVGVGDVNVGQNATVNIYLPIDINESITITVDGKNYLAIVRNGVAIVSVSGLASGVHDVFVSFENDKYAFNSVNTTFEVFKIADYDFIVDVADISVGENATVSVTLPGDVNGDVTVKFENKTYIAKNGVVEIPTDKLSAGNYEIVTTYGGDSKYVAKSIKSTFEVSKISNYNIFVNVANVKVGQNATVDIYVPSDINESITITVDGKNYLAIVRNGVASVNVSGLASGLHDVFVSFENDKYDFNSVNTTFEVFKVSDYQMNLTIQDNIKVNLPEDADGNVSVFINGKNYTEIVKNGVVNIAIPKLPLGEYNVSVVYGGNNKYLAREINTTFSVFDDKSVVLSADDVVMIYHDSSRLIASLLYTDGNPIANKTISFTIGGVTYNKTTDENGSAYLTINLDPGFYRATVSYLGNLSVNATVLVNSTINGSDLIKMYQNATQFYATFYGKDGKPLANMSVKFNINGVFYNRTTDSNGIVSLNINLNPGEYILTAYNDMTGEEKGFNVFVKSLIETMDLTKYYMNASGYLVKVWNKDGSVGANKNVTFNINGVFYTAAADENGSAKLAINLIPGDYIITTFVDGLAIGNNVSVLPTLETNDLTMEYGDGSVFSAKTLDGEGNVLANQNLTFNVNGVFYNKTTASDGSADLNINLMRGKYIITSYWGDYQIGNKIEIV